MSNHETKYVTNSVHLLMAFQRTKDGEKARCLRVVVRDLQEDLAILEARLRIIGGEWRIHKTINERDTEKARIWLLHHMIDNPDDRGRIDSTWRTALLQKECIFGEKRWLLDIDTKYASHLAEIEEIISASGGTVHERVETPGGWHFITNGFDIRKACEYHCVTLIRDGYVFIKKITPEKEIMICKCGCRITDHNLTPVEGNAPWFTCPRCGEEYVAG